MASIPNAVPDRTKLPKLAVLLHPSTANSLKFLFQVWDSAVEGVVVVVVEEEEEEEEQETEEEESLVGVFKTCWYNHSSFRSIGRIPHAKLPRAVK